MLQATSERLPGGGRAVRATCSGSQLSSEGRGLTPAQKRRDFWSWTRRSLVYGWYVRFFLCKRLLTGPCSRQSARIPPHSSNRHPTISVRFREVVRGDGCMAVHKAGEGRKQDGLCSTTSERNV